MWSKMVYILSMGGEWKMGISLLWGKTDNKERKKV